MAFDKFDYVRKLRRVAMSAGAYRVLITLLLTYSDRDGQNAFPGVGRLAEDCCMSERSVISHLKWLRERGYLRQETRGRKHGGASVYSLAWPEAERTSQGADSRKDESLNVQNRVSQRAKSRISTCKNAQSQGAKIFTPTDQGTGGVTVEMDDQLSVDVSKLQEAERRKGRELKPDEVCALLACGHEYARKVFFACRRDEKNTQREERAG
ncbi:helix-turn-helix domain-containing protein [Mycolicibacterium elephantis]|uniref:helix-turn-helix domain-containing protein n=1 Tax=Mycolicibacterium elephantis TaxID=81858 RepID=UPI000FE230CD|nr:helix-turn-helix domain-containing protein [Mycolicibacterium elephantis]MCV7223152.1 helix-turn-helix domain-containing protein [Mycolicibacterium elephantis]